MTHGRLAGDPNIMIGKPCVEGTRITVETHSGQTPAGRSFVDTVDAYPQLKEDNLRAALIFAADYLEHETVRAAE